MSENKKTVVLGVTGSIAVYKAVAIASKLTQDRITVKVMMTEEATRFISPLTFRAITAQPVATDMFDLTSPFDIEHVSLAEAADIVVIAPATANTIAKLAGGIADDILGCTVLATKAPVILAPAMHTGMYEDPSTQANLDRLRSRDFTIVGPVWGRLASGGMGLGRFPPVEEIIGIIHQKLGKDGDLAGKRIVITAGGTQEPIDLVRFIGNRSSGKMGYAIATAARDRGAEVVLISGPSAEGRPAGVEIVDVHTAQEMFNAVQKATAKADVLIMAAAVADYRPLETYKGKLKKERATLTLELERTPDILAQTEDDLIKVGFAAESEHLIENAKEKLRAKRLDLIVANDITIPGSGFGSDNNQVVIIDRKGEEELPLLSKREVADRMLDRVVGLLNEG